MIDKIIHEKYPITVSDFNKLYWTEGQSMRQIARDLGGRCSTLRKYVLKLGIKLKTKRQAYDDKIRNNVGRTYNVNLDFFKTFSPEMAWVLGVIASDGHVKCTNKDFGVTSKDLSFLEKVSDLLENERSIKKREYSSCYNLDISSVEMVKDLHNLGFYNNKSLNLEYPNIPQEFNSHFIRGYFDGDGWFYKQKTQHSTGLEKGQIGLVTGSESFANSLVEILRNQKLNPRLKVRERGHVTFPSGVESYRHETYIIRLTGYSVAWFYKFIYEESKEYMRLNRKYNKYSEWYNKFGSFYKDGRLNPTPSKAIDFNNLEVSYV